MNAHINHDLALAVVATCDRARRASRTTARSTPTSRRSTRCSRRSCARSGDSFLDQAIVEHGAAVAPLADLVSNFSIDKARDAAWVSALTLWHLRDIAVRSSAPRATRWPARSAWSAASCWSRRALEPQSSGSIRPRSGTRLAGVARVQRDGQLVDVVRLAAGGEADPAARRRRPRGPSRRARRRSAAARRRRAAARPARRGRRPRGHRPREVVGVHDELEHPRHRHRAEQHRARGAPARRGPSGPARRAASNAACARWSTAPSGSSAISTASSRVTCAIPAARSA